jgi:hypothetical protein
MTEDDIVGGEYRARSVSLAAARLWAHRLPLSRCACRGASGLLLVLVLGVEGLACKLAAAAVVEHDLE